jgi:chromate transporter
MCVLIVSLLKVDEVAALLGGGLIGMIWLRLSPQGKTSHSKKTIIELACISIGAMLSETRISAETGAMMAVGVEGLVAFSLSKLGFFFLKVGAVLFGGGFVLVAFLEGGLVHDYGWLSQQQLLDAIAIGQFTPGPILSTATFIGYLLSGIPGALIATIAIFFPSFFFVAALNPVVPRLRQSSWTSAFLDAVNVSSVALMLAVTVKLSQTALVSWSNWAIAVAAVGAIFLWKLNGFWLILGGATLGWLLSALGLT